MIVRLRNYSQSRRSFLSKIVDRIVTANMFYFNRSSSWACALLLVPKVDSEEFRFTVHLRPVNRFTAKNQFLLSILEQELTRTAGSR